MNTILVDDEPQIQKWLQFMLEKTGFPITLMGTFSNGKEAYEFCMEHAIDLVITDIRMPLMDGLQLIQQLKRVQPHIRFLILSAYDEFSYASEGLRQGASDYLLKAEIEVKELGDTLQRIKMDLMNEKRISDELKNMRMTMNENQQTLRNVYLKALVRGEETDIHSFIKKREVLDLKLEYRNAIVLAVGFECSEFERKAVQFQSRELLELAIVNVIDETLVAESAKGNAFTVDIGLFAVSINVSNAGRKSIRERSLHYAGRIAANTWHYLKLNAVIGISELYGDITNMNQQWKEASQALKLNLFYSKKTAFCYYEMQFDQNSPSREDVQKTLYDKVITQLELDQYQDFQEDVSRLVQNIEDRKNLAETQVKSIFLEIVYVMHRKLQKLSPMSQEELSLTTIYETNTFQGYRAWLLENVEIFMKVVKGLKRSRVITQVCSYITENYRYDISLQETADYVHLNKTYLSGLFKKEVGVNFNDYLTELRINKAKELIVCNEYKIGELAEMVGYTNPSHFTKVFKKVTGMSPMEYKKQYDNKLNN